jgi:small Trp-rich protein
MPLAVIAVLIFLMWWLDIGPFGKWPWYWALAPFALLFLWWEVIAPMIGWNKRAAEKKMADEAKAAEEYKKKQRGF